VLEEEAISVRAFKPPVLSEERRLGGCQPTEAILRGTTCRAQVNLGKRSP
jgi:hypothetical protein